MPINTYIQCADESELICWFKLNEAPDVDPSGELDYGSIHRVERISIRATEDLIGHNRKLPHWAHVEVLCETPEWEYREEIERACNRWDQSASL